MPKIIAVSLPLAPAIISLILLNIFFRIILCYDDSDNDGIENSPFWSDESDGGSDHSSDSHSSSSDSGGGDSGGSD